MDPTRAVERVEVATHDVVRAHEAIRDTFAGHRLTVRGSRDHFRYRQATATAGGIAVDVLQHTMGVREDVDPVHSTWVGVVAGGRFAVSGAGEDVRAVPGDVLLFPQGVPFSCEWQVMDLQVLRLPTAEVAARAAASTGVDPADFRLEGMRPLSPGLAGYCRRSVGYLHSLFRGDPPPVESPLVRAGALDTAAAAVLATFPSSATPERAGTALPAVVRRTVEFIDAHAAEPLTLADIVAASGAGPRALQEAFRRHRGTTPTGYLRRVRLERAHRELQAADPGQGATVAAVAARWGFAHRGRFAAAYREAYGRAPQQTLLS